MLGLKEGVCDLAEQSWALGGEFSQECRAGLWGESFARNAELVFGRNAELVFGGRV